MIDSKKCGRCQTIKPKSEFHKNKGRSDGVSGYCRVCTGSYNTHFYHTNDDYRNKRILQCRTRFAQHREQDNARRRRDYYQNHERELQAAAKNRDGRVYSETERREMRAYRQRYRNDNKQKIRSYHQALYQANKTQMAERGRIYREANPEICHAASLRRRALKSNAPGYATAKQIRARRNYYGGLCYICGIPSEAIDHVKPLAKGGANWPCNLRPICTSCNSSKHDQWPFDIKQAQEVAYGST